MRLIQQNGTNSFYLRKDAKDTKIVVNVTDLKNLWSSSLNEKDVLTRFKAQNPLLQAKPEWILNFVHTNLDSGDSSLTLKVTDDSHLSLELLSKSSDVKVKFHFILELQDGHKFFKEVTFPLVAVINQLIAQRSKLISMVQSKDLELQEYKLEGANISRKNVETDLIIEKEFIEESTSEFSDRLQNGLLNTHLELPSDLSKIFEDVTRIKEPVVVETTSDPEVKEENGNSSSHSKTESRKTTGSEIITQVPRAKQRKKDFKL